MVNNQSMAGAGTVAAPNNRRRLQTKDMVRCALFSALIAVGAFIRIPVPVVPFTLQFLFTTLAGSLLGAKLGLCSVGLYLVAGLVGLPVFASGGGISYVLQPSFGYLIGFALGAYVTGRMLEVSPHPSYRRFLAANFCGLAVVYLCGMVYYYLMSNFYLGNPIGLWPLFLYCFVLAVPGDILLCVLAATLSLRLRPIWQRGR